MHCWNERIQEIKLSHSTRFSFVRADLSVTGALQLEIVVVDTLIEGENPPGSLLFSCLDLFFHVFQWVYHCRLQNVRFSILDFLEPPMQNFMAENFDVMAILFYRLPLIENRIINKLKEPLNGYCSTGRWLFNELGKVAWTILKFRCASLMVHEVPSCRLRFVP